MTIAPAPDGRRPLGRPAILLGLVVLAVLALRGRLPEAGPCAADRTQQSDPVTLAGVLLLLSASMLITAIALLIAPPRHDRPAPAEERRVPGGSGVWSLRRLLVLTVGLALAVVLAVLLRTQLPNLSVSATPVPPDLQAPGGEQPVPGARPIPPPHPADDVFGYLAAAVAVLAIVMVISAIIARRRGATAQSAAPAGVIGPELPQTLAVAAERGLAAVEDLRRSPREAIIACYLAMETALAAAPDAAPQESDTPSEVMARAVHSRAVRAESVAPLVEVFAEARFSAHAMTEGHREAAERALRAVLGDLRGSS